MSFVSRTNSADLLAVEDRWGAHNYHPLPIVAERAQGVWVRRGRAPVSRLPERVSALNQARIGHSAGVSEQAAKVTLTRAPFTTTSCRSSVRSWPHGAASISYCP
jgi:ornithine--oxo-acid transaminase